MSETPPKKEGIRVFTRKQFFCPYCGTTLEAEEMKDREFPCPKCKNIIKSHLSGPATLRVSNERRFKRHPASLKVEYSSFGDFISSYTKNISEGGMFIKSGNPPKIGKTVEVFLSIPVFDEPVRILAEVVHHTTFGNIKGEAGVGVKFLKVDEESQRRISEFLMSIDNV